MTVIAYSHNIIASDLKLSDGLFGGKSATSTSKIFKNDNSYFGVAGDIF